MRTVALCTKDDAVLGPIARKHAIEVIVMVRTLDAEGARRFEASPTDAALRNDA